MNSIPADFPRDFLERYERLFPPEKYVEILRGMGVTRHTWFRLNSLRDASWEELEQCPFPIHRSEMWLDAGWVTADHRNALLSTDAVAGGRVYVQGMASQLPVRILNPGNDDRILDLAAAPGSKTLQIAAMAPEAELAAVELVRKRKFRLDDNLLRHGADQVRVFLQDGTKVWKYRPEHFDRILLDAPCSSEGRFRFDEPDSYAFWKRSKTKEMVRRQRRLLFSAVHALAPGGVLVYSTCSLAPEENEGVVQHALETFGHCLDIEPIQFDVPERMDPMMDWGKRPVDERIQGTCRLLPSERMEGFFVTRFRKTAPSDPPLPGRKAGKVRRR
ncbi:MAG: RsmB/NOP family class I SAM-dependent RNA methyltransferase [Bacteroidota bacterium]|nr:RsmB/NOP family class I SAM-dependent RNA methyltransferase [Bacteroidota bacterium]